MKITVACENCGRKITFESKSLPKPNPIAVRADQTGTRDVYVDCPRGGGETVAVVPLEKKPR